MPPRKKPMRRTEVSGVDLSLGPFDDLTPQQREAINESYEWAARELEGAGLLEQAARMRARKHRVHRLRYTRSA